MLDLNPCLIRCLGKGRSLSCDRIIGTLIGAFRFTSGPSCSGTSNLGAA